MSDSKKLTAAAAQAHPGVTYEMFRLKGWTDELLRGAGWLDDAVTPTETATKADATSLQETGRALQAANDKLAKVKESGGTPDEITAANAAYLFAHKTHWDLHRAKEAEKVAAAETGARGGKVIVTGQIELFKDCCYVEDVAKIMAPDGILLDKQRFDVRFGGREFTLNADGSGSTDSAWECFTQSMAHDFPKVTGSCFDPLKAPSLIIMREDGLKYVNTWRPLNIPSTQGDVSLYVNHIRKLFPHADDALIYLSFCAACVQYPGHKAAWAPFIVGAYGTGRGFLNTVLTYCIGDRYVHAAKASKLGARFDAHLYGKLLVTIEEIKVTEDQSGVWETLKGLITDKRHGIEGKGDAIVDRDLVFNMIFHSNHTSGLRKERDDRRICPLYTAQQEKADLVRDGMLDTASGEQSAYFDRLWSWFNKGGNANILYFLKHFEIPTHYNFAAEIGGCRRAPMTSATQKAIKAGLGTAEQDVLEAIESGKAGFRGGWVSSVELHNLLITTGKAGKVAQNKRRDLMNTLDYIPHPALPEGRMTAPLTNGTRPVLYIKKGHGVIAETGVMRIRMLYEAAQSG